ncbi:MAG: hypothetical protein M3N05_02060 [Pseudomonadota bacterium]|jgi:hypothetical protein|nr:hypothetical protein [Pseudomonadota bacterium]
MTQSDTPEVQKPRARAQAKVATGVPTIRQTLAIIAGTGAVAVLIGLLPRF